MCGCRWSSDAAILGGGCLMTKQGKIESSRPRRAADAEIATAP